VGLTLTDGTPWVVTRMGMLMPLVPGALIATDALNVPGLPPSAAGFTVTSRVVGKLPAVGLTLSQDVPVLVNGVAVKLVTLGLELERVTLWDVAAEVPDGKTKLSEFGFAEIGLDVPVEFAFNVTGMEVVREPEVTLTKPTSTPEVGAPAPMETVRTKGVLPAAGVTVSQLVSEIAATVTFAAPLAEEIKMVCGGVVTPV
jgi:hypothetical protein